MPTLREVRKAQEELVERLRKLQWERSVASPDRQEVIKQEIDAASKHIRELDTVIEGLIRSA
ncbi:MAG TPA: hypothetical protein VI386_20035 [Candidatus Sulfotelmatobacter sp.]